MIAHTAEVALPDFGVELMHDRPRTDAELGDLFAGGWPAFIEADEEAAQALPRVRVLFADLEVVLVDRRSDTLVAACWAVPIRWDGTLGDLPAGYSASLTRALNDHDSGTAVNTAVVCAAQVKRNLVRTGLAAELLRALMTVTADRGLPQAVAPLRLTGKHRYPLTPINDYLSWTRPDGSPFDAWLRTHLALGAHVLKAAPASQEFTGTCTQWEQWADLLMPASGTYIVRDALAPCTSTATPTTAR